LSIDLLSRQGELEAAMRLTQEAMLTFGFDDGFLAAALDLRQRLDDGREELPAPHLSVCMIARDEETTLPRCLASVAPIADEILVVDTGSADRTREVARVFGARVFEHPWTGDFSAARNHSLEQARGRWILVLDADETLAHRDLEPLRELTRASATAPRAYTITTRNYVRSTNKTRWVGNRGEYAEEAGTGWYPSEKVRLFSNDRRIRFENPVHELVEPALERIGIEPRPADIPVHHFGKLEEERVAEKGERYLELGIKKLDESTSPKALFELAVQAGELDRHADAVSLFEQLLARPDTPDELVFKAELNLGHGYTQVGRHQDALQISRRALAHRLDSPDAIVNFALAQLWSGEVEEATAPLESLVRRLPDFAPAVGLLAVTKLLSHQWAVACRHLDRLSDLGLRSQPYLLEHVQKLLAVGRPERAHALMNAARAAGRSSGELELLAAELGEESDAGEELSAHGPAEPVDALAG
jgi:tetratricopeptide (TPR) repeat protein